MSKIIYIKIRNITRGYPSVRMLRPCLVAALACALVFPLAGCQDGPGSAAPQALSSETSADALAPGTTALPVAGPDSPDLPSYSRNPTEVLDGFAAAIEARDWPAVRAFWGDKGERSGMDQAAFAAKWGKLKSPEVTIGPGAQEGGAGSLYYTAPITIVDGERSLTGELTMRRVNDVDGATTEQLRWHIETLTVPL